MLTTLSRCQTPILRTYFAAFLITPLPPLAPLIRRCRALAALDLILSPDWESRYYSFNARWADGEMMASMRDGCGDEWWILFHESGWAAMKGLSHESAAWSKHGNKLSRALQSAYPNDFRSFATEPAFRWEATSFAYLCERDAGPWVRLNDDTPYAADDSGDERLLSILVGTPQKYTNHASDYYETDIDGGIVEQVFALQPITPGMVQTLNSSTSLREISAELHENIGYPPKC